MEEEVVQKKLTGGSCVSILVIHENKYYICHLGDSRILKLSLSKAENKVESFEQLTVDHKPENEKEKKRIEGFGGKIYRNKSINGKEEIYGPLRFLPGRLSVSRSIGDTEIKKQGNGKILIYEP